MGCPSAVEIGDNLVFSITTHDPDTGVLTDADSAPSYRVYEDETGTAILNGSMAKLDDANTTGFYTESIACTSGNGFEDGKSYTIYIEATVDSDTGGISYAFKALSAMGLAATAIADALLSRDVTNVEDTASTDSLAELVMAALNSAIASTTWTIKKPSDDSAFNTRTVTTDSGADPIVGVT